MVHAAVEVCEPGDILVVTNTGPSTHGMFGELLANVAAVEGCSASSSTQAFETQRSCAEWDSQCGRNTSRVKAPRRQTAGSVNTLVALGEQVVSGGDVVCCDDDGVVIVPARHEAEHRGSSSAEARVAREAATRSPPREKGELGVDIYGLPCHVVRARSRLFLDSITEVDGIEVDCRRSRT